MKTIGLILILIMVFGLLFTACGVEEIIIEESADVASIEIESTPDEAPEETLKKIDATKTIIMVVSPIDYADMELSVPKQQFESEGYTVIVASTIKGSVAGMLGGSATAEMTLDEINPATCDAIVVIGGPGTPEYLWNNAILISKLQETNALGKPVAAICLAPPILAQADLLNGLKAAMFESSDALDELSKGNVIFTGEAVTTDGLIVTANGPDAAEAFAFAVLSILS